ncbi:MAG: hypothetical protein KAY39_02735, partial [Burkholderiaceae bacterium]|nr:hypothetical protein [Burkholderiaceae bacterium]
GSTGVGGATTTSQIHFLNVGAWGKLVSDPVQVAAITPDEVKTLDSPQVTAMDTNIRFLSNAALAALQYQFRVSVVNQDGQIQSISAAQIGALSPEQVRWIGATGVGGGASPAKLEFLNVGAFAALASSPEQVAAITPLEVKNLYSPQITALGLNLTHLSDAALGALKISFTSTVVNQTGQVQSISAAQVQALTPAQIAIIASLEPSYGGAANTGIAYLNATAFASLSAAQLAVLSPANVVAVSAAQWASLSPAAFAGLQIATALSLSKTQKSLLSAEQHTACGC